MEKIHIAPMTFAKSFYVQYIEIVYIITYFTYSMV